MAGRTAPKLFRARATQALAPREGGLASAQFRFDTPQLAAGSFILNRSWDGRIAWRKLAQSR